MSQRLENKTIGKLKPILWTEFSLYTKLTHRVPGSDDWCQCYTCDKLIQIKTHDCQGGHFMGKGAHNSVYFDEMNVRPQCFQCNHPLEGNRVIYEQRLRLELGDEAVDDLKIRAKQTVKRFRSWYIDKIIYYRKQNAALTA